MDCTCIVCGVDLIYENGARVKTSFLSNLFGDIRVMGCPELYNELKEVKAHLLKKADPLKLEYPAHVLTVSQVYKWVHSGIAIEFHKNELHHCDVLDSQKRYKTSIYGRGFLLSDKAAADKLAADKLAADKAIADKAAADKAKADKEARIKLTLSDREMDIIKNLGQEKEIKGGFIQ
jgi:hypothetical protein